MLNVTGERHMNTNTHPSDIADAMAASDLDKLIAQATEETPTTIVMPNGKARGSDFQIFSVKGKR